MTRSWLKRFGGFVLGASLFGTTLLASMHAIAAGTSSARAWLDRDTMRLGETITLNVEATDAGSGAQPDFSALAQDFNVLSAQSGQQVSIANSATSTKTLWAVGLEPKHEGQIAIAPFTVGNATTAAIHLNVLPAMTSAQQAGGDVFLEVTAEPLAPYVQQQVRYTLKLYYAFDLTDGNLGEPHVDGVGVQRLGQDKSYVANVGARRYHVLERHYALTPERSGAVDVPALQFRGTALNAADPASFFGRGRSVSAQSDAVHLQVKPRPSSWTDPSWLPAASLLLKDEGELPTEVHVGEPVTRTVRLQAQGLGYEQLPELSFAAPDGAEMYPDKTDTRTRDDGEWLYGERVRKFAFVPDHAGSLTLPGMSVHWWDTANDRLQTAELPARTINVLPAAGTAAQTSSLPGSTAGAAPPGAPNRNVSPLPSMSLGGESNLALWKMLATIGFVLWIATLFAWWYSRQYGLTMPRRSVAVGKPAPSTQRAAFLRACALGDLATAEHALVAWAHEERADVRNLGELAARIGDEAQCEVLSDLQRARYAGLPAEGIAARLQRAFKAGPAWKDTPASQREVSPLPSLYPDHD